MEASVPPAASSALDELLDVSPQVSAAIVLERDGSRVVASAPTNAAGYADGLARTCASIVEVAERSRRELGREPVSQVEIATPDGHVFVVSDARFVVAAVTECDPTVGLVFYDLKTTLRAVRDAATASAAPLVSATEESDEVNEVDEASDDATSATAKRWRKRNNR